MAKKDEERPEVDPLAMSDEQAAALETELAGTEPAKSEADASAGAGDPAAAASEASDDVGTTEAVASDEPEETIETLREKLRQREERERELRKRLRRERERSRATASMPAQPAAPAVPVDHGGVPIELGEDGQYRIKPDDLKRALEAVRPAEAAVSPALQYARMREEVIEEAEDQDAIRDTIEDLETAYRWLDQRVLDAVRASGEMPRGVEELVEFMEDHGITERFAKRFPHVDVEELVEAPNSTRGMKKAITGFLRRRGDPAPAARDEATAAERGPKSPVVSLAGRPRPMIVKGRAQLPKPQEKSLGDMSPLDVLSLSDEEILKIERQAR